jgi:hypothetical protein
LLIEDGPRVVEFRSIKHLMNRMSSTTGKKISVEDAEVPSWQRNVVWTDEEMGLLALSIIQNYPIGVVILWFKRSGVRVPIDGRQRLSAIQAFFEGRIAIPDFPAVPDAYKNKKYKLLPGDSEKYALLELEDRERFDDYPPMIIEFDGIDESVAMDIFIKLQGGKSLTKNEVRSALGGALCDYVTELTSSANVVKTDDDEDADPPSHHPFFRQVNLRNVRKAHRNLCDVLLHEYFYEGKNKHWSSLETMYREKASSLSATDRKKFSKALGSFQKACTTVIDGKPALLPQLRSAYLILTFFRAWSLLRRDFALPSTFDFASLISSFELQRVSKKSELPWVQFTAALSNAGYAEGRIEERHQIFMSYVFKAYPKLALKDKTRSFTEEQKIAIWERAAKRCEFTDQEDNRCEVVFSNFRTSDADHVVRWVDGGATSLENGRLLCQPHNRGRKEISGISPQSAEATSTT